VSSESDSSMLFRLARTDGSSSDLCVSGDVAGVEPYGDEDAVEVEADEDEDGVGNFQPDNRAGGSVRAGVE
jgi:hypothetical protein